MCSTPQAGIEARLDRCRRTPLDYDVSAVRADIDDRTRLHRARKHYGAAHITATVWNIEVRFHPDTICVQGLVAAILIKWG